MAEGPTEGRDVAGLVAALSEGLVRIRYRKRDGTAVERVGTTNGPRIQAAGHRFSGRAGVKISPAVLVYYEVGASAFKSFLRANLIGWRRVGPGEDGGADKQQG